MEALYFTMTGKHLIHGNAWLKPYKDDPIFKFLRYKGY